MTPKEHMKNMKPFRTHLTPTPPLSSIQNFAVFDQSISYMKKSNSLYALEVSLK